MQDFPRGIADFIRQRRLWEKKLKDVQTRSGLVPAGHGPGLRETEDFGENPGNLRMLSYAPPDIGPGAALVVVLHGCGQTAAGFGEGSGWVDLAAEERFLLLLPEQRHANNPGTCFNWFVPDDARRGSGELASIHAMILDMVRRHEADPSRIFVTGLSAGGAMTSNLLAAYPELFAGGAIVAGLPFGTARNTQDAFASMAHPASRNPRYWGDHVRAASPHAGPWPRIAVWHGTADETVSPGNAGEIVKQWISVHELPAEPSRIDAADGYTRRIWLDASGAPVIEENLVPRMGHGMPVASPSGPFLLDVGIPSARRIAEFWGLARPGAARPMPKRPDVQETANPIQDAIDNALKLAGLKPR